VDRAVVQTVLAQSIQVGRAHPGLRERQPGCEIAQGPVYRRERGRPPVSYNRVNVLVRIVRIRYDRPDLFPEVMRVRKRSVVAPELGRDHCGQKFALDSG